MLKSRSLFEERVSEIRKYAKFLLKSEKPRSELYGKIDSDVKRILKANVYLLSYNIIESIVRNVFEEIYDHIKNDSVDFHDLNDKFKIEVIRNTKKYMKDKNVENIRDSISNISKDIIHITFNRKDIFNGNVDEVLIKEKIKQVGFSIIKDQLAKGGKDLSVIKHQRNSLAHGDISFHECGRDLTLGELLPMLSRTKKYLEAFLDCSEEYLSKQLYRKIPPKEIVHVA